MQAGDLIVDTPAGPVVVPDPRTLALAYLDRQEREDPAEADRDISERINDYAAFGDGVWQTPSLFADLPGAYELSAWYGWG